MILRSGYAGRRVGLSPVVRYRLLQSVLGLAAALLLSGCGPLQPLQVAREEALPAADTEFWQQISAAGGDNWFQLLNTGEEALRWRLNMIDVAAVSIDMDTFLWKPDRSGRQIFDRLLAAADRGVRVRVLLDDSFTMHEELMLHALDEHPLISLRIYNPFRHRSASVVFRQLFSLAEFSRINHRMHNKTLTVDGRLALVGGRNLGDEYFGLHEEMNFRDLEVVTEGGQVEQISKQFDDFWNSGWAFPVAEIVKRPTDQLSLSQLREQMSADTSPRASRSSLQQQWLEFAMDALPGEAEFFFDAPAHGNLVETDEDSNLLSRKLTELIGQAQTEIVLVTAYLVPTQELEDAIEAAEARGVEVRILTNSLRSNNHLAAHAAYAGHLHRLIGHGADLHEVRANAANRDLYMLEPVDDKLLGLHAKLMLIDQTVTFIGSANLDPRSLEINTEVGLIIHSRPVNQQLRNELEVDFHPANAWHVRHAEQGGLVWVGEHETLQHQPANSLLHRLEDWFVGLLPIDQQM